MMNMNLNDAVKNLVENGGSINFSGYVDWIDEGQDYDVNIQLVEGNRLSISVDFEDGTDASNSCPVINNVDEALDEINDYLTNDLNIDDFDMDDFDNVEYDSSIN